MTYRPLAVGNGTTFDTVGDPRIGAAAGGIPQASVADLTTDLAAKTDLALTQSVKTGDYTFAKADLPNLVVANKATAIVFTLPTDATVSTWGAGSTIKFLNIGAGVLTITAAGGVTINANTTFATSKGGMLIWTAANTWTLVPFSGGVSAAVISSTTGSPTITGITGWTVYDWPNNGTVVIGTEGEVEVLVIGGGGGCTAANNIGAGGYVITGRWTLAAGTHTIVVGAGGAVSSWALGGTSQLGPLSAGGGGQTDAGPGIGANDELTSDITGTAVAYAGNGYSTNATPGRGAHQPTSRAGTSGRVILRVKA